MAPEKVPFTNQYSYVGGPSIDEDCKNFEEALRAMACYCRATREETQKLLVNVEILRDVLEQRESPQIQYYPIATGAYKECYALTGAPDYIVKFCSTKNRTQEEMDLLKAADAAGLSFLFLPTYFVPITSMTLPAALLDENAMSNSSRWITTPNEQNVTENPDWKSPELSYIEVQPKVSRLCAFKDAELTKGDYNEDPIEDEYGNEIPLEVVWDTQVYSRDWLIALINLYGVDTLYMFVEFVKDHRLFDFHMHNLGYISKDGVDYPVILDWLSNE